MFQALPNDLDRARTSCLHCGLRGITALRLLTFSPAWVEILRVRLAVLLALRHVACSDLPQRPGCAGKEPCHPRKSRESSGLNVSYVLAPGPALRGRMDHGLASKYVQVQKPSCIWKERLRRGMTNIMFTITIFTSSCLTIRTRKNQTNRVNPSPFSSHPVC